MRIGCQAFKRCWRKAVSIILHNQPLYVPILMLPRNRARQIADVLGGLRLFCFLSGSSCSRILLESACSMVCDMFVCGNCTPAERGRTSSLVAARLSFPSVRQRWPRSRESALLSSSSLPGSSKGSSSRLVAVPHQCFECYKARRSVHSASTSVLQTMFEMRIIRHKNTKHGTRSLIRSEQRAYKDRELCSLRELFYLHT